MSRRDDISMSPDEVDSFLSEHKYVQIATLNPDESIHLVPLWYLYDEGRIGVWTYGSSRKVQNLRRVPQITALVENHSLDYQDLKGVQIRGTATIEETRESVLAFGEQFLAHYTETEDPEVLRAMAEEVGEKRVVIRVEPETVVSWDHTKLEGGY